MILKMDFEYQNNYKRLVKEYDDIIKTTSDKKVAAEYRCKLKLLQKKHKEVQSEAVSNSRVKCSFL